MTGFEPLTSGVGSDHALPTEPKQLPIQEVFTIVTFRNKISPSR